MDKVYNYKVINSSKGYLEQDLNSLVANGFMIVNIFSYFEYTNNVLNPTEQSLAYQIVAKTSAQRDPNKTVFL